jgi:ketosteroid isomerase-like protein
MPVFDLHKLCGEFTRAVNAGALDALCTLYDDGAVLVGGPGQAQAVVGPDAIRQVLAGFPAPSPMMEFEHEYLFEAGDTALARGRWKLTNTGPGGSGLPVLVSGCETWTLGEGGLIAYSEGRFDAAGYERQLSAGAAGPVR